ncbi:hypothetical protein [Candidatus Kuenenia sp.]
MPVFDRTVEPAPLDVVVPVFMVARNVPVLAWGKAWEWASLPLL